MPANEIAARLRLPKKAAAVSALGLSAAMLVPALVSAGPSSAAAARPAGATVVLDEMQTHDGAVVSRSSHTVPLVQVRTHPAAAAKKGSTAAQVEPKVSQRLTSMLSKGTSKSDQPVRVLVTFTDDQQVPRMPTLDQTKPATAAVNTAARARAATLVANLKDRRAPGYRAIAHDIGRLGGTVLDTYWLIKGVEAQLPRSAVSVLAARPDVRYVEPAGNDTRPPDDDEDQARVLLGTDPYFTAFPARSGDRVAILDTGVQTSHTLLSSPSRVDVGIDFIGEGSPDSDPCNHGTKTAAAISGNGNLGNDFRGITGIQINNYKVYPTKGSSACQLSSTAAVKAFQHAVSALDKVIVAEMQSSETEDGSIATNADAAFDAGAVVVAANGNNGPAAGTVNSPANARKVLGIGAVDVQTFEPYDKQSLGPTRDGRIKPDVVAPTNVETANAGSPVTSPFTGTSGAVAQAGGTAAMLRAFLRGSSADVDPGHVYAGMILGGGHPFPFDNVEGAGKLKLPAGGIYKKFSTTLTSNGVSVGVKFDVPATSCRLSGALWWPETAGFHNDVDLELIDPNGVTRATSTSGSSVFELARVNGPITSGKWTLMARNFNVKSTQKVYAALSTCR